LSLGGALRRNRAALAVIVGAAITIVAVLWLGGGEDSDEEEALQRQASEDPQVAALLDLSRDSETRVTYRFEDGFPQAVHFKVELPGATAVERATAYLDRYGDL
jgi:hypothetical protein